MIKTIKRYIDCVKAGQRASLQLLTDYYYVDEQQVYISNDLIQAITGYYPHEVSALTMSNGVIVANDRFKTLSLPQQRAIVAHEIAHQQCRHLSEWRLIISYRFNSLPFELEADAHAVAQGHGQALLEVLLMIYDVTPSKDLLKRIEAIN